MKTHLLITAILFITVHQVVNAQNPKSPLAPISVRANEKAKVITDSKTKVKALENINKEIAKLKQQIAELQEIKADLYNNIDSIPLSEDVAINESQSVINTPANQNTALVTTVDAFITSQEQAEALYTKYQSLYNQSKTLTGVQKEEALKQYKQTVSEYEIKRLEASLLLHQITIEKYTQNQKRIKELLVNVNQATIVSLINKLENEAAVALKAANEMREEANAQPNNASKLGAYSNAEEKEELALNKQHEAINTLQKTTLYIQEVKYQTNEIGTLVMK